MSTTTKMKSATATLNTQNQDAESLNKLLGSILKVAGCLSCGRVAILRVDLVGDPNPDFTKLGGISLVTESF
jgi:hypothetical protein